MTLIELKEIIDFLLQTEGNEDLKVCIPNNKPSMGYTSVTYVKNVCKGFDWDSQRLFIYPENEMTECK